MLTHMTTLVLYLLQVKAKENLKTRVLNIIIHVEDMLEFDFPTASKSLSRRDRMLHKCSFRKKTHVLHVNKLVLDIYHFFVS